MRLPTVRSPGVALRIALLVALGISALVAVHAADGQAPPAPDASVTPAPGVSGRVVDAASGEPIGEAFVLLLPLPEGALSGGAASSPASVAAGRRVRTDADGRYRFQRLAAGTYRLHVSRIGYTAVSVDVTIQDASPDVGVGLVVAPVLLTAVRVSARATPMPSDRSVAPGTAADDARLAAERARQAAYVSTDVRALTEVDVGEAVTLAESDLFRGLQRAPGVSTRDELSAELWTRGGRADQTRILYDGLPLFAPFHAYGLFSAVSPEAVGAAFLHPGVRPASLGEGSAGVLDLRSAPGRADRSLGGRGEVGIASARVALDGAAGPLTWNAGVRRSYFDAIANFTTLTSRRPSSSFPFSFADAFLRADYALGGGRTLVASGIVEGDRDREGSEFGLDASGDARWGSSAARLTFNTPLGALRASQTIGTSGFVFRQDQQQSCLELNCGYSYSAADLQLPPKSRSAVHDLLVHGELSSAVDSGAASPWTIGYEVSAQRTRYTGRSEIFSSSPGIAYTFDSIVRPRNAIPDTALDGRATVATLWGTRRWTAVPHLAVETGLRLEHAAIDGRGARVLPAPRVALSYDLGAGTHISAAAGRSFQYAQSLPRVGVADAVRFSPASLWVTAHDDLPPLTTDLVTVGAERWLGHDWLASANAYWRRAAGVATQDPTPGVAEHRPLFVVGRGTARGVELSARRLTGRTTGSISYGYGVSTLDAAGFHYLAPEDRTHTVDLTIARRLSSRWRLAGALSAATGAPYTRIYPLGVERPDQPGVIDVFTATGTPNVDRRPPAYLLGTEAEWTHQFSRWQLGVYGQLQSALATSSTGSYRGDDCNTTESGTRTCSRTPRQGTFPILPTVGLRFAF